MNDQLWSVADVAKYLNVKDSAVRRWIYEQTIRFHKIGRLVRFMPEQIVEDFQLGKIGRRVYEKEK